jgi:glycosyltransferase involved in cell wall biosynthesis
LTKKVIGFDCRYIRPNSQDGISRFSTELFSALSKEMELTAIVSDPKQLESLPDGTKYVTLHGPTSILEPLAAMRLNKYQFDAVFSPMQTMGSLGKKFKLILTVHDLIFYSHPKPPSSFNVFVRILWRLYHTSFLPQKLLLRGADEVATVSETTKRLIIKNQLTNNPVTVIPNAANQLEYQKSEVEKKIVYMGSFMPYKNVEDLVHGVANLDGYSLILLSRIGKEDKHRLQSLADTLGAQVEFADGVSDEEYAHHLSSATALVHASSDEGFGIPIIEAMSLGCPVVCSDIPIFREIAGDAGLFFELGDHQQFAKQVIAASEKRVELKERLMAQANTFSWDKSAKALAELLG